MSDRTEKCSLLQVLLPATRDPCSPRITLQSCLMAAVARSSTKNSLLYFFLFLNPFAAQFFTRPCGAVKNMGHKHCYCERLGLLDHSPKVSARVSGLQVNAARLFSILLRFLFIPPSECDAEDPRLESQSFTVEKSAIATSKTRDKRSRKIYTFFGLFVLFS